MSKTTILYVSMVVVFVVGLWTIVQVGHSLRAPNDLSGTWALVQQPAGDSTPAKMLTVAQSGRFAKVKIDDRKPVEFVLISPSDAPSSPMVFESGDQRLTVASVSDDDAAKLYRFSFDGPVKGEWKAKRDSPAAAKPPAPKH